MSFIFSTEDEYEEVEKESESEIPEVVVTEENIKRKEVYVAEPQTEVNKSIFVEVESTKKVEVIDEEQDYRSYRSESRERSKDTRHCEADYIPQQIISPIFGMSEKKEISEKDVKLNDMEAVRSKPSTNKIISPIYGVNKMTSSANVVRNEKTEVEKQMETTKQVDEGIIMTHDVLQQGAEVENSLEELEALVVDTHVEDEQPAFKLYEINDESNAKEQIMNVVGKQLSDIKTETKSDFAFAYRGNSKNEQTKVFAKPSDAK